MVGPEGHRFLQGINMLAAGSPTHFLRILSYGLANLKTMNEINCWLEISKQPQVAKNSPSE